MPDAEKPGDDSHADFVRQITACQSAIYAFALSLLGDTEAASDIQQETNLVIWSKIEESREVKNFRAWAMKIAYYEVKNYRRRMSRSSLVFDSDVMELLAQDVSSESEGLEASLHALHQCVDKLPKHFRLLIEDRYQNGISVKKIASRLEKSANHVGVMLFRIRAELHQCITRRLKGGQSNA